jgi:hypothetical protein
VARFTGFCCSARCPRARRVARLSSSKGQNNLSLMLKRSIGVPVRAALVVALLTVLPAVAQAQEGRTPIQEAPVANRGADVASATPFATFGFFYAEDDPQEATRSAPSEEHKPHTDSGNSTKGSDSLDDARTHATVTPIARSRHRRPLRTRNRGAGRPPRDPTVSGTRLGCQGTSTTR